MATFYPSGGGGAGSGSSDVTAGRSHVLEGYTAITRDSNDEPVAGTILMRSIVGKNGTIGISDKYPDVAVIEGANSQMNTALNGKTYVSTQPPNGYYSGYTYVGIERSEIAPIIGLTAAKLAKGQTVAGVAGTYTSDANATANKILSGYTAYVNGAKITGNVTISSVVSFSVAAYSTNQVICTWKNPAKGPYSGVAICAKTGGYPSSIQDSRKYTGAGNNSALNATNSVTIGGLSAGQTYYFRIWVYATCNVGDMYSGYLQATCAPTAHGRKSYNANGSFTVPSGVRSISIHCTGGGGHGVHGHVLGVSTEMHGGSGGGGGYTSYANNIGVSPGDVIGITVGAGGISGIYGSTNNSIVGGTSMATRNGSVLVQASGGGAPVPTISAINTPQRGGSSGGLGSYIYYIPRYNDVPEPGSSDGNGTNGQKSTTREFGLASGTLYAGGGGGAGGEMYHSSSESSTIYYGQNGGAGGGGKGGDYYGVGAPGSNGTGGGGGGGGACDMDGGAGGSGNVIITW